MKLKSTLFLSLLSAIISSCETADIIENSNNANQIRFTASDFQYEASTKTDFIISDTGAEFQWSENDTVGIFPDTGSQVYFPMASGAGTKTAFFDGGGWALKSSSTYAAYYPFKGNIYLNKTKIPVSYVGQNQVGNNSTEHLGAYDYLAASATTPANGNVNFQFKHLGALIRLVVTMDETSILKSVKLVTDEEDFITSGYVDLTAETPYVFVTDDYNSRKSYYYSISLNDIEIEAGKDLVVYFLMPPVDLTNKSLKAIVSKSNGYYQEVPLTGKKFEAGKAYELKTSMISEEENPTTIHVEVAGKLETLLRDLPQYPSPYWIKALKVTGNINGTDIRYLREMAGRTVDEATTNGGLTYLDLTDANIVEGGDYYIRYNNTNYYTKDNIAGDYMFRMCKLETIKFPSTITKIGLEVCSHLTSSSEHIGTFTSIIIPNGVTSIDYAAFAWNQNLASIEIPNTVKEIGHSFIYRCDALTTLNIPNSVETIHDNAFFHAWGLQNLRLTENEKYTRIASNTFAGCKSLKTLRIPKNIISISDSGFGRYDAPSALEELHFDSSTPPYLDTNSGLPETCKIYVPKGSYNTYKFNDQYRNYTIIEE
ncbi:leucine-rich repeat protein [Mediterranea massiliensis]|uniref:leucine-rich repeat protein n=1 Tax=Mediterranea massiliensis TaxID=1841865 RepID=UPI0025A441D2|nr:leucine-rich repeat protein [Mediterranea massiliensis]MDM8337811.1 leucine-rich repeat protein [Mediterranea massiliensis]